MEVMSVSWAMQYDKLIDLGLYMSYQYISHANKELQWTLFIMTACV